MVTMQSTAIIIPCFNEEKRMKIEKFSSYVNKYSWLHFIFVDDGSTDNTLNLIEKLCALYTKQIHHICLKNNSGKATAVWYGFQKAINMGFEYLGYWDADLATPLSALEKMCEQLSKPYINFVFGSRVRLLQQNIKRRAIRHYLGRIFATIASLVLGLPIYDTQCGAKIFKNTTDLQRVFKKPFLTKWIFDVEIFARFNMLEKYEGAATLSKTAIEYPLPEWCDIPGSKFSAGDFFKTGYELIKIGFILHCRDKFTKYKFI
jgi:dolichyl-phosphate beta-glucosyltransferase